MDSKQTKLYTYIGFAAKAGKFVYGDYTVEKLLKKRKLRMVIVDHASDSTLQRYIKLCSQYNAELIIISGDMEKLNISGKVNKILGLKDKQFSDLIIKEYKNTALKAGVD